MTNTGAGVFPNATYSVKEVADILGICLPAAYELCNRADFPAIRVTPRRIIIPVDGLQRWMEEQSGGGKKEPRRNGSVRKNTERENMAGINLTAEQNTTQAWEARFCLDLYGKMPDNIPDYFDTRIAILFGTILSAKEQLIAELHYRDGYKQADIARALGVSRQRVNEILSKCKSKFQSPRIRNVLGFETIN